MKKDYPTEVLELTIDHIDRRGYGVARYIHPPTTGSNGKHLVVFIPNVVPGDVVRVSVPNAKGRKRATLEYDELIEAGPGRNLDIPINEPIPGGTPLRFMKYDHQLAHKLTEVKAYMEEKGFNPDLVHDIIGMDQPDRYRNKMELTFGPNGELGMHQQGNFRKIIDLQDSAIAPELMIDIKHIVSQWQAKYQLQGYNKDTHEGLLRNLLMRVSFATGEIMVAVFATESLETMDPNVIQDLVTSLTSAYSDIQSLMWIKHADVTDSIQADEIEVIHGRDYIHDEIYGYRFRLWHNTFFQPNPVQAEKMIDYALDMAQVQEDMRVLDLFCGVGTFSLPLASRSKELAGIEIVESSIESAKRNAVDNGLDNTYFVAIDARQGMKDLPDTWGRPDLLLLDPPRSGAGGKVMRAIGRLGTEKVVYVSCNPKTMAEDMVWLRDFGYELKVVQPIDQFPHTPHVECIVLMEKVQTRIA